MQIQITLDSNAPLTEKDRAILAPILGNIVPVEEPAPATAKPARTAKPAPAKTKPAPVEEPEVEDEETEAPVEETEDEDLLGGEVTLQDAIDRATELVSSGKSAQVKAALAKVGAKRVSDIKPSNLKKFIDAL